MEIKKQDQELFQNNHWMPGGLGRGRNTPTKTNGIHTKNNTDKEDFKK